MARSFAIRKIAGIQKAAGLCVDPTERQRIARKAGASRCAREGATPDHRESETRSFAMSDIPNAERYRRYNRGRPGATAAGSTETARRGPLPERREHSGPDTRLGPLGWVAAVAFAAVAAWLSR
jgi:hypothetical protein